MVYLIVFDIKIGKVLFQRAQLNSSLSLRHPAAPEGPCEYSPVYREEAVTLSAVQNALACSY